MQKLPVLKGLPRLVPLCVTFVLAWSAPAAGQQASLDKCQKTLSKAGQKFVKLEIKAISRCLQKISGELLKAEAADASRAAGVCVKEFRKTNDSRGLGKSLPEKLAAKVAKKCDPATNGHALGDLTGSLGLHAANLGTLCESFGGDGAIDDLDEWLACLLGAHGCDVYQAIALQYPRTAEWLAGVRPFMAAVAPPPTDPSRVADALDALDALVAAVDDDEDGAVDLRCGPRGGSAFVATGQTASFASGDDGDVQAGGVPEYADNGDGTITDVNTGLVWEKKSDDDSLHDKDVTYPWSGECSISGALCQTTPDCGGGGNVCTVNDGQGGSDTVFTWVALLNASSFAGQSDWRVPNVRELESIIDYGTSVAIDPIFNGACGGGCTVLTCSCFGTDPYWTSTPSRFSTNHAWVVAGGGDLNPDGMTSSWHVRAVRGGL